MSGQRAAEPVTAGLSHDTAAALQCDGNDAAERKTRGTIGSDGIEGESLALPRTERSAAQGCPRLLHVIAGSACFFPSSFSSSTAQSRALPPLVLGTSLTT